MSPTEKANKAWNEGLDSTANPYARHTVCWCMWAEEFLRLNDEYMSLAVSD